MKVELVQHKGTRFDGFEVEFEQWQIFATGSDDARVLVGYLSYDPSVPMMLICNQPMNLVRELVAKCEAITNRTVLPPCEIVMPPEIDNSAGEDDESEGDDADSE